MAGAKYWNEGGGHLPQLPQACGNPGSRCAGEDKAARQRDLKGWGKAPFKTLGDADRLKSDQWIGEE